MTEVPTFSFNPIIVDEESTKDLTLMLYKCDTTTCGPIIYTVTATDGSDPSSYLSFDTSILKLGTSDNTGLPFNKAHTVTATAGTYSVTSAEFLVTIISCAVVTEPISTLVAHVG